MEGLDAARSSLWECTRSRKVGIWIKDVCCFLKFPGVWVASCETFWLLLSGTLFDLC